MKITFKYIGIVLSVILPLITLLSFININTGHPYARLWCGFYGCSILVCIFTKSKAYKAVAIILNLAAVLLWAVGTFMGGLNGL